LSKLQSRENPRGEVGEFTSQATPSPETEDAPPNLVFSGLSMGRLIAIMGFITFNGKAVRPPQAILEKY
jgi:hypothetical protein